MSFLYKEILYKQAFSLSLLRCTILDEEKRVLEEIYKGEYDHILEDKA